ncbi:glycosyltransferase [Chthonomonas calidirosea]|uniref:glycosyltransferase n=1 Tax=Chthonomonas calidirosea TaxID=454171 RepID=UPI0006DD505D|nr:glycosyltransferase [Chthonomonas calidirosea]CEK15941.1 glycosyltransferase [Chthonomonas calidirosea]
MKRLLCIATAGGGQDAIRIRRLTEGIAAECTYYDVDRKLSRKAAMRQVRQLLRSKPWDLVYLEGTGIAGGLPLIWEARTRRLRYIVSSGDPVGGFFLVTQGRLHGWVFGVYEKLLYRHCVGFIGWTPYLTGVALHLGAPRGITIEGAVDLCRFTVPSASQRQEAKRALAIPPHHLVCGVVGSLNWTERQRYCYGLELIETLKLLKRADVTMLIVGDGSGLERLQAAVPASLQERARFTGRLQPDQVPCALHAMDIGFITQTLDKLGSFRLTTKLPEYLASGVAVAMSPIPGYYDYVEPAGWPLPPYHPTDPAFHRACAQWLDALSWEEVQERAAHARPIALRFDYQTANARFRRFVEELLA